MKKTSLFENALIWFGAGVSIAEILTGTYLAPLGLKNGILAIVAGHVIGCILLFLAGVIGGKCDGFYKDELWTERLSFVCGIKCTAACWMDSNHDL